MADLNAMNTVVDRPNRDALVVGINRYLDGETTAFKFVRGVARSGFGPANQ